MSRKLLPRRNSPSPQKAANAGRPIQTVVWKHPATKANVREKKITTVTIIARAVGKISS